LLGAGTGEAAAKRAEYVPSTGEGGRELERRLERSDSILPIRNIELVATLLALANTAFLHY